MLYHSDRISDTTQTFTWRYLPHRKNLLQRRHNICPAAALVVHSVIENYCSAMWVAALLLLVILRISNACFLNYADNTVICTVEELGRLSGAVERRIYTLFLYTNTPVPKNVFTPNIIARLRIYPELAVLSFNAKECSNNKTTAFAPFTRINCIKQESLAYDDLVTTTTAVCAIWIMGNNIICF